MLIEDRCAERAHEVDNQQTRVGVGEMFVAKKSIVGDRDDMAAFFADGQIQREGFSVDGSRRVGDEWRLFLSMA